ncbi:hypothetical protein ACPWSR_14315 [Alloiococcus sp. CFN-8]|uniref:hypothetical protein n=1 Tax=Alloiococcus sp. CFN-8 TaxID=3416081 RepID=UPI003CF48F51
MRDIVEMDLMDYSSEAISSWYSKGELPVLNVIATPYNTPVIFGELIGEVIKKNKKILYITNVEEEDNQLIKYIKSRLNCRSYSYIRKGKEKTSANILFINHEAAMDYKDDVELVIYDDLNGYSTYSRLEIQILLDHLYKYTRSLITYSTERIFCNSPVFEAPTIGGSYPIREPRVLTTRIDLSRDIPYIMYDYLSWFTKINRKVIIYTPNRSATYKVYNYLVSLKDKLKAVVHKLEDERKDKNIEYLMKAKDLSLIVITNCYEDNYKDMRDIDVIVFNADHRTFDNKKLLFFCGKVGLYNKGGQGEVILLANETTDEMDVAKNTARRFNKVAWERGFFSC